MTEKKTGSVANSFHGLEIFRKRLGTLVRQPVFIFITVWGHAAIITGTIAFYYFEKDANPKIHTILDTFYWSVSTVTTVGYGDAAPVTTGGKIVGMAMMVLGSLFLWSYTALFAGGLVAPEIRMVEEEVGLLGAGVKEVEKQVLLDERTARSLLREVRELNQAILRKRQEDENRRV